MKPFPEVGDHELPLMNRVGHAIVVALADYDQLRGTTRTESVLERIRQIEFDLKLCRIGILLLAVSPAELEAELADLTRYLALRHGKPVGEHSATETSLATIADRWGISTNGNVTYAYESDAEIQQLDIDLPEIQEIDAKEIIRAKLTEARQHRPDELLVEDTSLYLKCLNGLPGPLIKWLLQTLGDKGLSDLAQRLGDDRAEARTFIGYANRDGVVSFFEDTIAGRIVSPRGEHGFGWDRVFQPDGSAKTFAEMSGTEKNAISMRRAALEKFLQFYRSVT